MRTLLTIAVALSSAAGVVTVSVHDPDGAPLAGVMAEQKNSPKLATDSSGKLTVSPSGSFFILRKPVIAASAFATRHPKFG